MNSHPLVLCSLCIIFFISKCNSTNQKNSDFISCSKAMKCGSLTSIPYPFSVIQGCGHPGFLLKCHNNQTLFLKVNQGVYRVLSFHAHYDPLRSNEKPIIDIADENVFINPCGYPNITFNSSGSRFALTHEDYKVMANLIFDCPKIGELQFLYSPCNNSCSLTRRHHCYFAYTYENGYAELNELTKQCHVVKVPLQNNTRANKKPLHALLLEGFQVEWNASDDHFVKCKACQASGGLCGYNDQYPFVCYCGNDIHHNNCQEARIRNGGNMNGGGTSTGCKLHLGIIIGGSIACVLLISIAATYMVLYMRKPAPPSSPHSVHADDIKLALSTLSLPVFNFNDLEGARNCFDESRQLGDGGFGCVYHATLGNGQVAAVKRLYPENTRRTEQFVNEVKILSSLCHPNLIQLIGFCQCRHDLLLVYEYVPNGTLADHLHGKKKMPHGLPWKTRLDIALQIARALEYLHFSLDPPVFHRDIKSGNILLDMYFRVKVADFGLCKLLSTEASHVSTIPQGTPGYLDPDYNETCQLTGKSDVYSFGVVLFEIITGKKAVETTRNRKEMNLACLVISNIQDGTLHDIIDPRLGIESDPLVRAMVSRVCEVGFACLALRKDDRPDMMEVVVQLEQIRRIGYGSSELFYTQKDNI